MRANTREDTLEELRKLAFEKEWLESVVVAHSVEDALKMAEHEYRMSEKGLHMSCLVTGSSFLVAEALAFLDASEV
jgi:ABC-type molybdenum transport system ATPase subunit/photorepair protein PhrA